MVTLYESANVCVGFVLFSFRSLATAVGVSYFFLSVFSLLQHPFFVCMCMSASVGFDLSLYV